MKKLDSLLYTEQLEPQNRRRLYAGAIGGGVLALSGIGALAAGEIIIGLGLLVATPVAAGVIPALYRPQHEDNHHSQEADRN
jgi:hypothetical protein